MKCKFCNAENDNKRKRCKSCNARLQQRSNLSKSDYKNLSNYIKSIEQVIKKAKKKSIITTSSFLLISLLALTIFSRYIHTLFAGDIFTEIIAFVSLGLIIFSTFGNVMKHFVKKAMINKYYEKIYYNIEDYLKEMNYKVIDMKSVAYDVLEKKSPLLKYLNDFDMLHSPGFQYQEFQNKKD